jgi:cation-transporting ATPase 13A1
MTNFVRKNDSLVEYVSLYVNRHWLLHAYVSPFILLYGVWMHAWLFTDFYGHSLEAGLIALAGVFILQTLLVLACHWSVHMMALVTCSRVKTPLEASFAKFVPTDNNGSAELVQVHKSARSGDIWCMFQKLKYLWLESEGIFAGLEFPVNETYAHYLEAKGQDDDEALVNTRRVFGDNK